ncbi:hypothetical protein JZ785_00105 [Alicyclobacillus curvatus]|nr:hypothetical protein JZ785_00105 [Alicyclobacillus curvatus]
MNFEEFIKQGLMDAPGGAVDDAKINEIVERAQLTRNRARRSQAAHRFNNWVRNAGIVSAAVVITGVLIGSVLWSHQNATTSNISHGQSPVQNTLASNGQNPHANSASPTTNVPSSATLQMYGLGKLTAYRAIPWPGLQPNSNQYYTTVPVVQVPFTATVSMQKLTAPKTIATSIPPQLQGKLVAYYVQYNATTGFYLLGPSGMTGTAELATDGSFEVYLHGTHARIELDTSGASPLVTNGMAAPFFTSADTAVRKQMSGTAPGLLSPATVIHPNANTAYFSFATKNGQKIAGWQDYLPQSQVNSARMIYAADSANWPYAQYVLRAGVNLLDNVLAPQIKGRLVQSQPTTATINGQSILIPNSNGVAANTSRGVVFIWEPPIVQRESMASAPWSRIPTAPYSFAFSTPHNGEILPNSVQLHGDIPYVRTVDGDNHVYYAFPHIYGTTGTQWLLYTVTWAAPGMNQPANNDLHVYDLETGRDTSITSFLNAGGLFFSFGTSGKYLTYDKSGIIDAKGDTGHSVWLVDLTTGKQTKLPTSDLIKSGASSGKSVRVMLGGKIVIIPLNEG